MPIGFISGADGSSPEDLFRSIPLVSRALLVGMILEVFCETMGIFGADHYALAWPLVWNKFHVWRLASGALYPGPPSFGALIHIFMIGMPSIRYEVDGFSMGGGGGSADYAYMLMFGVIVMQAVELILFYRPAIFIGSALTSYITYVWSRKNPTMTFSFWGIKILAVYVPWAMVAISVLTGQSIHMPLLGIAVGHLFFFLVDVLPDLHDVDLLRTPKFLVDLFGWGNEGSGVHVQGQSPMRAPGVVPPPRDVPSTRRRPTWGAGRTLGSS